MKRLAVVLAGFVAVGTVHAGTIQSRIERANPDARSRVLAFAVRDAAKREHISPDLLLQVMKVESYFQIDALSDAGARGVMQIMYRYWGKFCGLSSKRELWDAYTNVQCGAKILRRLLDRFKGNLKRALCYYNGGHIGCGDYLSKYNQ